MFIKQRQVRRSSKFSSRFANTTRKRREYVAQMYTGAAIQGMLFIALLAGAYRAYQLMQSRFTDLAWYLRFALPVLMLGVAGIVLWAFLNNIREIRELSHTPPPDSTS